MEDTPLYNSRITSTYVEYLRKTRPEIDIEDLLNDAGIAAYELADEGHWLTQKQVDSFHDALMKRIDDPAIFREAGRYMGSAQSFNAIRQFILGFITPIQAYIMLGKASSYLNRGATVKCKKISRNRVEIITTPAPGVKQKPYQCENLMGSLEAVAKVFTNKLPVVEHPVCIHHGGKVCRYVLSWEEPPFLKWRTIRNYIAIPSLLAMAICAFLLPLWPIVVFGTLLAGTVTWITYYANYIEKKDIYTKIEMQGDTANRLLDHIKINYDNALLVQEIGQAVSSILNIDELLKFVMETLQKRLNLDRGMIMLANLDRTKLIYASGYGYSPELETLLKETQFHLDNPKSKGPLVVAFKEQRPFLINEFDNLQNDVSERTLNFVETLGVKSFICIPIIYEGISEGVLAVDNYRSNRPHSQSEVSLLMGIAPQIAISIHNAKAIGQIMESEERFRTLSENSPDIIYTTDNEGIITYINPAGKEILGYGAEEMLGHHFKQFVNEEDAAAFVQLFRRVERARDTVKNFEARLLAKDGTVRVFYMSGAPNFNAMGDMIGVVGTLKDFTEQKKLEQQLHHASRMNAIGRLTGGIAHDFNNILQAINAYNQILTMRKTVDDPDWRYLLSINELTKRATDLVSQLLIFSRKSESNKFEPVDINEEIKRFYDLLVNTLPKAIKLHFVLADQVPLVNGDAAQLGQIIMNLTVNAKDAMPNGGELKIETKIVEFAAPQLLNNVKMNPGLYVLISVSDTGHGIKAEHLNHIFEPFFTTKEAGKGTGIGLSVVYGIVKNHDGYILCTSEPGRKTVFDVYLPALEIKKAADKKEAVTETELVPGQETILLVDDESSLLETGQELLSLLGYQVLTADSGENALSVIRREGGNIALVILDLMMPGMGGAKCLAEILKIVPSMKVVVASGYTASIKTEEIITAGAAAFIHKPYQLKTLSKIIREILDQAESSSQGRMPLHKISGV